MKLGLRGIAFLVIVLGCVGVVRNRPGTATVFAMAGESLGELQEQDKAPDSKPTVYIYRIKKFAGSALSPSVYCDDKELARIENGRYFVAKPDPGKHTLRMGDKQTGFEIDMKPGQTYYASVSIETGFWKGHGRLTLMQPEQGAFEVKKLKPLDSDKVKDRSLVVILEGSEQK